MFVTGVIISSCVPYGIQAAPPSGRRCISSALAHLMEPASYSCYRHHSAVFGLKRGRECGIILPGNRSHRGAWRLYVRRPGSACTQASRRSLRSERADRLGRPVYRTPIAIRTHNTIHAGARAQQKGGNLRRCAARCTPQENMKCEQRAIPGTAEDRTHLDLLCWRDLQ